MPLIWQKDHVQDLQMTWSGDNSDDLRPCNPVDNTIKEHKIPNGLQNELGPVPKRQAPVAPVSTPAFPIHVEATPSQPVLRGGYAGREKANSLVSAVSAAPKPAKKREPERPQMSASLTSAVQPILLQLQDEYNNEFRRIGRPLPLLEVIKELQNAFDLAERSCPGLTDDLVSGILTRLLASPSPSTQLSQSREADVRRAMEKVKRS
ncbi:hypothetical protein Btru_023707 [Bulinus truncatus]|nr:hypothetical protein Btru_023707 [Bulinus truncatus]